MVIVGVPARNEEALIERSIRSILAAADAVARVAEVVVVIACDGCTDETVAIADRLADADLAGRVSVVVGSWESAGASRAAAIAAALQHSAATLRDPSQVWIATTDADTVVPLDWLVQHLRCWERGDHAIAGIVELLVEDGLSAGVVESFRATYALGCVTHPHVHGANLGVRADAYQQVNGFPDLAVAEDHALWRALLAAGYRCRSSVSLRVATSGRLTSRAAGGFADTLAALVADHDFAEKSENFCA